MGKVVAFVPIKLNNERLPGKNIRPFKNGGPLINYVLDTLLKVKNIDEIFVYCSDAKIQEYLPTGVNYLTRDVRLDSSSVKFNEVLTSFADDVDADVYVLAHATAPFIKRESFETAINSVMNNGYDSAVGVHKMQEFLWKEDKPLNYDPYNIPRTQDLPMILAETCGLYVYNRHLIKNEKRRIGDNPFFVHLSRIESIDINDEIDFEFAETVFQKIIGKTITH